MKFNKKVKALVLGIGIATLFIGCASDDTKMSETEIASFDGYVIQGSLANGAETKIFLEEARGQAFSIVDTAMVNKRGEFLFKGNVTEKGLYRIRFSNGGSLLLAMENDKMNISADMLDATNYTVSGSNDANLLKQIIDRTNELNEKNNALVAQSKTIAKDASYNQRIRQIQGQFNNNNVMFRQFILAFVDTTSSNMMAAFAAQSLDTKQDYELMKDLAARFEKNQNQSFMERNFIAQMNNVKRPMGVGTEAPDINMADPNGKEIALSDLKGEVILVDFWASWCRPCRAENPNVVRLYNQYKNKGFNIYSVSLDKQKNKWEKAILDDKLAWSAHVSELKGWQSAAARQYGVSSIPRTFLLDSDQNIIAMNLRGKQLEDKLAELLN